MKEITVIDYIVARLKERQERGLKKYGFTIDECKPPTGEWYLEIQEELLDALQYSTRKCMQLEGQITSLKDQLEELQEYSQIHKELKWEE